MKNYKCTECNHTFCEEDADKCPKCGSQYLNICIRFGEHIAINDCISAKVKQEGTKKPVKEVFMGADRSISRKKYVNKSRIIDRENNYYEETVTDPDTGEVMHICKEPLTDHWGHGSDKKNK